MEIEHEIGALEFSADGRYVIASGGPDDTLVWDRRAGAFSARIPHGGMGGQDSWTDRRGARSIHRGAFVLDAHPTKALIATAGPDRDAALWDLASGSAVARFPHEDTVTAVRFAPSGAALATVTEAGVVRVWDVASGRDLRQMPQGSASYWVGISPRGTLRRKRRRRPAPAGVATRERRARRHDRHRRTGAGRGLQPRRAPPRDVRRGSRADRIWDLPAGTRAWEIPMAGHDAAGVVFAADDRELVFAGSTGRSSGGIRTSTCRAVPSRSAPSSSAWRRARDRGRIATNTVDGARVWDARTQEELRQIPYAGWSTAVAISADGRWLASTGRDGEGTTSIDVTEISPANPRPPPARG